MKRNFAVLIGTFLVLASLCSAQFIGYVSPQSVQQNLAVNVACTGTAQNFAINNLGQTQHYLQISGVLGANKMQAVIQGFDTQGNVYQISDTLVSAVAGTNLTVQGSGYFARLQASITCFPATTATFTATYSGAWGTFNSNVGAYLQGQVEKLVFNNVQENTGQAAQFFTPFGSSAGQIAFQYSNAGAGGTLTVTCLGISTNFTVETFSLANLATQQIFTVPSWQCPQVTLSYSTNGVSGNVILDYFFAQPGSASPAYQYTNITTNASTVAKAGPGFLHSITINNIGTTETLTLFDNTSCAGGKIGTTGTITAQQTLVYDVNFLKGLCVTSAGTSAGDFTVSYQ
jgi:hypothetical protein